MSDTIAFGKYRLIAELGHGGMADVFLAVNEGVAGFSKLQVIKRLRENLAYDSEFIAMLIDEARIAARLNHPNIVQTNEVGDANGRYYIAMEYLNGQPLHRVQHRAAAKMGGMALDLLCVTLIDTLRGLHHAHELTDYDGTPLNIVHRDMTPHNIFVTYDGVAKVVDFGIAKAAGRTQETRHGIIKGKIRYMAPEQALGREIDRRADIFAIGILLWEAVTKKRMWADKDDPAVLRDLVTGAFQRSPAAVTPDVDPRLDEICKRALALEPKDRFPDANSIADALEDYLGERLSDARRKLGPLVAKLFEDKRAELNAVVERQLTDRSSLAMRSKMPQFSDSSSTSVVLQVDAPPSTSTPTAGAMDVPAPQPIRPQRRLPTVIATLLVAGVLVGVGAWTLRRPADASATAGQQAPDLVNVTLRASPATATFSIDNGPPLQNPSVMRLARDGKPHVIHITAPGFKDRSETTMFAADIVVDLALEKLDEPKPKIDKAADPPPVAARVPTTPQVVRPPTPQAPPPVITPATVATHTPPPPAPPAGKSAKDSAKIDKGDPWSN